MNNGFYFKVLNLIKIFENRPHHLAKFIVDNNLFTEDIIKILENSPYLYNDINMDIAPKTFFKSIKEVEQYYENILHNENIDIKLKIESLKEQLEFYLEIEDYIKASDINNQINVLKIKLKK